MILAGFEIPESEIEFVPIRASGPGGQHVNKVSSAVHLRFDVKSSSLPPTCKSLLLEASDQRISGDGVIVIKAKKYRSQDKNKMEALSRLGELITKSTTKQTPRKATRPPRASKRKRIEDKKARGRIKNLRGSKNYQDS